MWVKGPTFKLGSEKEKEQAKNHKSWVARLYLYAKMNPAQSALIASLHLPEPADGSGYSEAEFLQRLADAVDYWMQHRMEQLMSLCYTLDVEESLVARAFHPGAEAPANVALARLLYERQRRRIHTKRTITSPPVDESDAW